MGQRILKVEQLKPGAREGGAWITYKLQTAAKTELVRTGIILALMTVFSDSRLGLKVTVHWDGDFDLRWEEEFIASAGQRADLNVDKLNHFLDRFPYLRSTIGVVRERGNNQCLRVNFGFDLPDDREAYERYFRMVPGVEGVTCTGTRGFQLKIDQKQEIDASLVETVRARASFQA